MRDLKYFNDNFVRIYLGSNVSIWNNKIVSCCFFVFEVSNFIWSCVKELIGNIFLIEVINKLG